MDLMNASIALHKYIDNYKNFADELKNFINDFKYKNQGGQLRYAIDFSEMFAYILPAKSYKDFFLINQDRTGPLEIASYQALHQLLLKHLFFETEGKIILLPPYILELQTFIKDLQNNALDNLTEIALRTFDQAETVIKDAPYFNEILSIIGRVEGNADSPLSFSEEQKIIEFIQKYGHILTLVEEIANQSSPLLQLRKLIQEGNFETLDMFARDYLDNLSIEQTEAYERWNTYLSNARGDERSTSSKLDATAIDLIGQINGYFQERGKNIRLLFFTRSWHMHNFYADEFKNGIWEKLGAYPLLRHPRVNSVLSILAKSQSIDPVQLAEDELDAIEIFLSSIPETSTVIEHIPNDLINQIYLIDNNWKKAQALVLTSKEVLINVIGNHENLNDARKILNLLGTEDIQKLVVETLDNLLKEIEYSYDLLAFNLQLPSDTTAKSVIRATAQAIPCYLRFSSDDAQKLVELFGPGKEYEIRNVIEAFKTGFGKESSYELVLAMAYILGVLNKWEKALRFCQRAIDLGKKSDLQLNEGFFFKSICIRKLGLTIKTFLQAQELLNQARETIPNDPRYLNEMGSQILRMNMKYHGNPKIKVPKPETGLYFLHLAEKNLDLPSDKALYAQILNNRFYFLINEQPLKNIEGLKEEFKKLTLIQIELEPKEERWPSFIQDTLAWGEWLLFSDEVQQDENRRNGIIRLLELAKDSSEISREERLLRIDHLNQVRESNNRI